MRGPVNIWSPFFFLSPPWVSGLKLLWLDKSQKHHPSEWIETKKEAALLIPLPHHSLDRETSERLLKLRALLLKILQEAPDSVREEVSEKALAIYSAIQQEIFKEQSNGT
jgi:hypothetical protein